MKKLIAGLAASACVFGAMPAMASSPYITPNAPVVFQGDLDVVKGLTLNCRFKLTVSGPNNASDTSPAFNHTDLANASVTIEVVKKNILDLVCPTISIAPIAAGNLSYTRTSDTSGSVTLSGVDVDTPTPGGCAGSINATWQQTGTPRLVVSASLPGGGSSAACTMSGNLNLVSPTGADIVAPGDSNYNSAHP